MRPPRIVLHPLCCFSLAWGMLSTMKRKRPGVALAETLTRHHQIQYLNLMVDDNVQKNNFNAFPIAIPLWMDVCDTVYYEWMNTFSQSRPRSIKSFRIFTIETLLDLISTYQYSYILAIVPFESLGHLKPAILIVWLLSEEWKFNELSLFVVLCIFNSWCQDVIWNFVLWLISLIWCSAWAVNHRFHQILISQIFNRF